jgi:acyl-CoA dehydrogenase
MRKSIREFLNKEFLPNIEEWEAKGELPVEYFRKFAEMGCFGMKFPEQYGGAGPDLVAETVIIEEISRLGSGGLTGALASHSQLALPHIYKYGTEEQKQSYLVPGIRGEKKGALGITEPNAGSDVASIETTAIRDGNYYIINGAKTFITGGPSADFIVLAVKTDKSTRHRGISLIIVDKGIEGFTVSKKLDKLGWRCSDTGELSFMDCAVPVKNLIGEENKGFFYIMQGFEWERYIMALASVIMAEVAYEHSLQYAKDRVQFGRPIGKFQVIQHYLADMATNIEAARRLSYYLLECIINGVECRKEAAMSKLFAGEMAKTVVDRAVQIHGGYGYMMEYPVQRWWRDERLTTIGGGTSEIMREIISSQIGLKNIK